MKESYLFDEQPQIFTNLKSISETPADLRLGHFALAFDMGVSSFCEDEKVLIGKVLVTVNQNIESTLLIDISENLVSFSKLKSIGIKHLIVFANQIPSAFDSMKMEHHKSVNVFGITIFVTQSIGDFAQNPDSKKILWSFVKSKL